MNLCFRVLQWEAKRIATGKHDIQMVAWWLVHVFPLNQDAIWASSMQRGNLLRFVGGPSHGRGEGSCICGRTGIDRSKTPSCRWRATLFIGRCPARKFPWLSFLNFSSGPYAVELPGPCLQVSRSRFLLWDSISTFIGLLLLLKAGVSLVSNKHLSLPCGDVRRILNAGTSSLARLREGDPVTKWDLLFQQAILISKS